MSRCNPQVNCESLECYYNVDGKCKREGIHCDLTFNGRATNAYPELIIDTIEEVGDILYPQNCNLNSVSIGFVEHSQKELVGNLK